MDTCAAGGSAVPGMPPCAHCARPPGRRPDGTGNPLSPLSTRARSRVQEKGTARFRCGQKDQRAQAAYRGRYDGVHPGGDRPFGGDTGSDRGARCSHPPVSPGPNVQKVFADGGYAGKLIGWSMAMFGWVVEIVKRNETGKFVILPKRWIVERTFAWLAFSRRLNRDYEINPRQSEAMVKLAMIHLLLKRLA